VNVLHGTRREEVGERRRAGLELRKGSRVKGSIFHELGRTREHDGKRVRAINGGCHADAGDRYFLFFFKKRKNIVLYRALAACMYICTKTGASCRYTVAW